MIVYLTYNDAPSGIYSSQVIDVINFLETNLSQSIRLVAFVSIRHFLSTRKKIKEECPKAIILPMFPKMINWEKNYLLLFLCCFKLKPNIIIGRSVLATQLALKIKDKGLVTKVIYDGRGAIAAEWKEYEVVKEAALLNKIDALEKNAILKSDFRIAVSEQLVKYWQNFFNYTDNRHVVIPCTINKILEEIELNETQIDINRNKFGLNSSDIVFIYAGSVAGWQSFNILQVFLAQVLNNDANSKVVFLSDPDENIIQLQNSYPNRIIQKKVKACEVQEYLIMADYGLLIREDSITNKVASPVKFAEYLACGLKIIISDKLGDYTDFVNYHHCGEQYTSFAKMSKVSLKEKQDNHKLAIKYFTKKSFFNSYKILVSKS